MEKDRDFKAKVVFYNASGTSAFWVANVSSIRAMGYDVDTVRSDPLKHTGLFTPLQRIRRRFYTYIWFFFKILFNVYKRADINVSTTNPFFSPYVVNSLTGRRAKKINLIYDLYPEVLVTAGLIKENSLTCRVIRYFFERSLSRADITVFLGKRIEKYVRSKYPIKFNSCVIPVGADGRPFQNNPPLRNNKKDIALNILYSGNLGHCHEIDTLLYLISKDHPGINIDIHAYGVKYPLLKNSNLSTRVNLGGRLNDREWHKVMLSSHIALVTMKSGANHTVFPSKVFSAMVSGQAIIAICPLESDLADLVRDSDCGWVLEPGDLRGLDALIQEIEGDRNLLFSKRLNSFNAGHSNYNISKISNQWCDLFEKIV